MTQYQYCDVCQAWMLGDHQHGLDGYLSSLKGDFYIKISDFHNNREAEIYGKLNSIRVRERVLNQHGRKIQCHNINQAIQTAKKYLETGEV